MIVSTAVNDRNEVVMRVRDTGVIVIGYRPASLPFSYLDAQLRPTGYTVELCDRIVSAAAHLYIYKSGDTTFSFVDSGSVARASRETIELVASISAGRAARKD